VGFAGFYALGLHRYLSWDFVRANVDAWRAEAEQHLLPAMLLCFGVYVTATALSLPIAAVLSLAVGALFGRWLGTGLVAVAATLGAALAFLSSRYLFRDLVQRRFGARLERLNQGVEKEGGYYLLTLRLVPLFPFWLVNLGMGLTRMRGAVFAGVSFIGMLPGTFVYVNAGTAIGSVESPAQVLSPEVLLSLALLGIVPLVLRLLVRRWVRPRAYTNS
jgi:uncharacterized membrane protein YdjX (TVP38/TMEM64 family)